MNSVWSNSVSEPLELLLLGWIQAAIDMLEQKARRVVLAVVYVRSAESKTLYSIVVGDKTVRGMIVGLVEYIAVVNIVLIVLGHGIHRPAPHRAVVVP